VINFRIHSTIKLISVILIMTFLTLDVAWAHPADGTVEAHALATQSPFMPKMMTQAAEAHRQSVFSEWNVVLAADYLAKELFNRPANIDGELYLQRLITAFRNELGEEVAGRVALDNVVFEGGIILFKYTDQKGEEHIIQVARKGSFAESELIGQEWIIGDNYAFRDATMDGQTPERIAPEIEKSAQAAVGPFVPSKAEMNAPVIPGPPASLSSQFVDTPHSFLPFIGINIAAILASGSAATENVTEDIIEESGEGMISAIDALVLKYPPLTVGLSILAVLLVIWKWNTNFWKWPLSRSWYYRSILDSDNRGSESRAIRAVIWFAENREIPPARIPELFSADTAAKILIVKKALPVLMSSGMSKRKARRVIMARRHDINRALAIGNARTNLKGLGYMVTDWIRAGDKSSRKDIMELFSVKYVGGRILVIDYDVHAEAEAEDAGERPGAPLLLRMLISAIAFISFSSAISFTLSALVIMGNVTVIPLISPIAIVAIWTSVYCAVALVMYMISQIGRENAAHNKIMADIKHFVVGVFFAAAILLDLTSLTSIFLVAGLPLACGYISYRFEQKILIEKKESDKFIFLCKVVSLFILFVSGLSFAEAIRYKVMSPEVTSFGVFAILGGMIGTSIVEALAIVVANVTESQDRNRTAHEGPQEAPRAPAAGELTSPPAEGPGITRTIIVFLAALLASGSAVAENMAEDIAEESGEGVLSAVWAQIMAYPWLAVAAVALVAFLIMRNTNFWKWPLSRTWYYRSILNSDGRGSESGAIKAAMWFAENRKIPPARIPELFSANTAAEILIARKALPVLTASGMSKRKARRVIMARWHDISSAARGKAKTGDGIRYLVTAWLEARSEPSRTDIMKLFSVKYAGGQIVVTDYDARAEAEAGNAGRRPGATFSRGLMPPIAFIISGGLMAFLSSGSAFAEAVYHRLPSHVADAIWGCTIAVCIIEAMAFVAAKVTESQGRKKAAHDNLTDSKSPPRPAIPEAVMVSEKPEKASRAIRPEALQVLRLFEIVEAHVSNRRSRMVKDANALIAAILRPGIPTGSINTARINNTRPAVEVKHRIVQMIAAVDAMERERVPGDVINIAKNLRNGLDQLDADSIVSATIALARGIKRERPLAAKNTQRLLIGLGTDWMPGYTMGKLQHTLLNPVLNKIKSEIESTLLSMGLDVEIVIDGDDEMAAALKSRADQTGTKLSHVIAVASKKAIEESEAFKPLRSTEEEKRAYLIAIDPRLLLQEYAKHEENDPDYQIDANVMEMLSMALDFAASEELPAISMVDLKSSDKARRILVIAPSAQIKKYRELKDINDGREAALQSA
jgi:hypothetical protein